MDNELQLHIDHGRCVRCGLCLRDCAPGILEFGADGFPRVVENGAGRCTKCQHCLAVCPAGALSILGRSPENSAPCDGMICGSGMLSLIRSRRSFRSYRHENLDAETLEKLKSMLAFVPTGVNDHRLYFSFVDDLRVMDEIRNAVNGELLERFRRDPASPELGGFSRYAKAILAGRDIVFRGAPHMVVVSSPDDSPCPTVDPVIALSYFELYAQSLGVGTVWCGLAAGAMKLFPEIAKRLCIPEGYSLGYAMLFGPTDLRYRRATQPEMVRCCSVK